MTAEVAILTKQAVALAADSAVTIGEKVFSTLKVFALSKSQPVGIMVYNAAEVMGVPVETVIKEFRRTRGKRKFPHLGDYAEEFKKFLEDDPTLFTDEIRRNALAESVPTVIVKIRNNTVRKINKTYTDWGHPTSDEASAALSEVIDDLQKDVDASPKVPVSNMVQTKTQIKQTISSEFRGWIKWLKMDLPVERAQERKIHKLVLEYYLHEITFGDETGFVITGFGEDDVFPGLRAFEFVLSALWVSKVTNFRETNIDHASPAAIIPFAQRDMMMTFMEGMDPKYEGAIPSIIKGIFDSMVSGLDTNAPDHAQSVQALTFLNGEVVKAMREGLKQAKHELFVRPTMQVVSSMPKEELAVLAEALISLTALKRKASSQQETVAGPTDVAVISKGDGFIWIKRKHYFDPKLNPAFTMTYCEEEP